MTNEETNICAKAIFAVHLDIFLRRLQALVNTTCTHPINETAISTEIGRRYIRIVRTHVASGNRSAWGFVDMKDGSILKAAGWKVPAKHARGSIFNANPLENVDQYGPKYLR